MQANQHNKHKATIQAVEASSERLQALHLLKSAASPEHRHLILGVLFLLLAAGLEALGPYLGKTFIDRYLLPRQFDASMIAILFAAYICTGWLASWLRYLQLTRLAGVAMRSVQRLREQVYQHVLRLPMRFLIKRLPGN